MREGRRGRGLLRIYVSSQDDNLGDLKSQAF
jgi:hypothetical protein